MFVLKLGNRKPRLYPVAKRVGQPTSEIYSLNYPNPSSPGLKMYLYAVHKLPKTNQFVTSVRCPSRYVPAVQTCPCRTYVCMHGPIYVGLFIYAYVAVVSGATSQRCLTVPSFRRTHLARPYTYGFTYAYYPVG
jgi:hypothetical protein